MNRLNAVALRCSGALNAHAARALTLALFLATILIAGAAGAQGRVVGGASPPTIDGNINDLINYAAGIGQGCLDTENLPIDSRPVAGDVCKTNALLIPCNAPQVACSGGGSGTYFLNGYDLTRAVAAYDRANQTLYLGLRVAGIIGDANGDGTPDAAAICSPALLPGQQRVGDPAGIGPGETYVWNLDTNCDGVDDINIGVQSGVGGVATVFVNGAAGTGSGAYVGSDLEVKVTGIALPFLFTMNTFAGATPDGLSEDATNRVSCGPPNIDVAISKVANPPAICASGTTIFTISVENTGEVPVTATLTDDLPAELAFDDNVTGDFSLLSQVGQHLTFNDLVIPIGATRTVSFRVKASAECFGSVRNNAKVVAVFSEPCVDFANGGVPLSVERTTFADVLCKAGPCVTVTCSPNKTSACQGEPIDLTVRGTNCGSDPASITLKVGDQTFSCAEPVPAKGFCEHVFTVIMPACTDGQDVQFASEATITNDCASKTVVAPVPCAVKCKAPNIDITKEAEATVDPGGTIHYKITVTNTSKVTDLEKIKVIDTLCDFVKDPVNFAGTCTAGAPEVVGNVITWPEFNLAAGASCILTFEVTAVGNADPCNADVTCRNDVTVTGYCADASATASASASTLIPCSPPGLCRLTGGGCLNEDGDNKGHKQSTFGGNSSPAHEGGGPTGNSWEHVYRDGRTILFNWHSWDAHVILCTVVPPGPCHPAAENTKADFVGTGKYSIGAGGREEDGNMVAYIIDHREGSCNRDNRDEYSIIVRTGLVIGEGTIVFQTSGEIDCGNLQIHETPARLFGNGTTIPGGEVGQVSESVALLNKAFPNPFSGVTTYNYRVTGASSAVEVGVYNVAGRLVKTLASGSQSLGTYTVTWNGTDEAGVRMAPGVYFLKARVDAASTVNRIIYIAR